MPSSTKSTQTTLECTDADGNAGGPFAIIKRTSDDIAHVRSLDAARMWVYSKYGICIDLMLYPDPSSATTPSDSMREKAMGQMSVIEECFGDIYSGAFANFTKLYRKHGGIDGDG